MNKEKTQLTFSEVQKSLNQLNKALGGKNGQFWFEALKKFNRKENPFNFDHELKLLPTETPILILLVKQQFLQPMPGKV